METKVYKKNLSTVFVLDENFIVKWWENILETAFFETNWVLGLLCEFIGALTILFDALFDLFVSIS